MNIFVLDKDSRIAASMHNNKHVIKMILESAQLLGNAVMYHGGYSKYAATHMNHPCSIWARTSKENWVWLSELMLNLNEEYKRRYNKTEDHKSVKMFKTTLLKQRHLLPDGKLTEFVQCMPEQYKSDSVVESYRKYYEAEKNF